MAEKNLTLAIVLAAKRSFDKDSRFQVSYTRTSDTYPSLSQRAKLANNRDADMFLCVHINSASASARGTETLWSKGQKLCNTEKRLNFRKTLATAMQSAAVAATGFTNRGLVDRPNLYVLKHTEMPGMSY
ncbi:MAG: N-acetylmuramoyl-L-alanine amidase [Anaerobutyricum soehngenii]